MEVSCLHGASPADLVAMRVYTLGFILNEKKGNKTKQKHPVSAHLQVTNSLT